MAAQTPHLVCIPFPAQSHIGAMMKLAKLLHHKGFHITFVNTELNHNLILNARGPNSLDGLPSFKFKTIPDGQPPSVASTKHDLASIIKYFRERGPSLFLNLIEEINDAAEVPPVTCILSDGFMPFIPAAQQLGLPHILFWTISACSLMAYYHFPVLIQKGLVPLEDESYLSNGFLDTIVDWIPGMKDIRLKDLPGNIRTTDPNNVSFNFSMESARRCTDASANIIHTFYALEKDVLDALSPILPNLYTIGPLQLLPNQVTPRQEQEEEIEGESKSIGINLWKEESECIRWLDLKEPGCVIYVNFGSLTCLTRQQLIEIGWGLASSRCHFLWIIRPNLVIGESAVLAPEFEDEVKKRGLIASWCPQEQVLNHPSVGGFFTHCGWSSTMESLFAGVPMICWPFYADQQTNCRYICSKWGVGLEMDYVSRYKVEELVREIIGGEEGLKRKKKAMEWKKFAEVATSEGDGSSSLALDNLVSKIRLFSFRDVSSKEYSRCMY